MFVVETTTHRNTYSVVVVILLLGEPVKGGSVEKLEPVKYYERREVK